MPVTRPVDGAGITTATVEQMYTDARGLANAVPFRGLGVDALGHQHLPSLLVGGADQSDYLENVAPETVTGANPFTAETLADIRGAWKTTGYSLNNGGPGYSLPACKVLAFCSLQISIVAGLNALGEIDKALYLVLGREDSDDTGVFHADLADIGTVFVPQNKTAKVLAERYPDVQHTVTLATVIDKTVGGAWTLENLYVKAASALHGDPVAATYTILHGSIGFFCLYRDS